MLRFHQIVLGVVLPIPSSATTITTVQLNHGTFARAAEDTGPKEDPSATCRLVVAAAKVEALSIIRPSDKPITQLAILMI